MLALKPKATFENGLAPIWFDVESSLEDFLPRRPGFGNTSMLIADAVSASNELMMFWACDGRPHESNRIRTTASFVCNMPGPFQLVAWEPELQIKGRALETVRRGDGLQLVSDGFHFVAWEFL